MTARTLILLRHAKAQHPAGLPDLDRPLTDRGHADATAAGAWLASHGYVPDLVLCSPARRTRQTWHGVALGLTAAPTVRYDQRLYQDRVRDLFSAIRSEASALLDPSRDGADSDGLRTCGMAVHEITGAWSGISSGAAPVLAARTARA